MKKTIIIIASILAIVLVFGAITTAFNVENAPSSGNNNTPPVNTPGETPDETPDETPSLEDYRFATYSHPEGCEDWEHSLSIDGYGTSILIFNGTISDIDTMGGNLSGQDGVYYFTGNDFYEMEHFIIIADSSWAYAWLVLPDGTLSPYVLLENCELHYNCNISNGNDFVVNYYDVPYEQLDMMSLPSSNVSDHPLFAEFFN